MLLLFLVACGGAPEADSARAYVTGMQPNLSENGKLAQRFLTEASRIKKHETDGSQLAEAIAKELAPQAASLAQAVAAIQPDDPRLRDTHARVVAAWGSRASAYSALSTAWAQGDLAAWDVAMKKNTQAKLEEETYFAEVNAYLGVHQLALEQYPAQ